MKSDARRTATSRERLAKSNPEAVPELAHGREDFVRQVEAIVLER
jgi:hypothetical protein